MTRRDSKARNDAKDREAGAKMRRAAETAHETLDDPMLPDRPTELAHMLYFAGVVGGGFLLNLAVLAVVAS